MKPNEKFREWVQEVGTYEAATLLKCTRASISHWSSGKRGISPKMAIRIEKRTRGRLTRRELLPELFEPLEYD